MAKTSILTHRKFRLLCSILKIPPAHALGHLEMLWLTAHCDGTEVYASIEELEAACGWVGKPGQLAAALCAARLIDKPTRGQWVIHDYWEHAPDYVVKRHRRKQEAAADNGGQRRPEAANVRPTDPDPDPKTRRRADQHPDPDHRRNADRDRPINHPEKPGSTPKSHRGGPPLAVQALIEGLTGVRGGENDIGPPRPEQPIGSYTARECAAAAAALERTDDKRRALAMWSARVAEMSSQPGGLEAMRDMLTHVAHSVQGDKSRGIGQLHKCAAWLNQSTAAWLRQRSTTR